MNRVLVLFFLFFALSSSAAFRVQTGLDYRYKKQSRQYDAFENYLTIGGGYQFSPRWSVNTEFDLGKNNTNSGALSIEEREYNVIFWGNYHFAPIAFIRSSIGAGVGGYLLEVSSSFFSDKKNRSADIKPLMGFEFATRVDFRDLFAEESYTGFINGRVRALNGEDFRPTPVWSFQVLLGTHL